MKKDITKGVMKEFEDNNIVMYRAACSCGEPEHDLYIEISKDLFSEDITCTFYTNVSSCMSIYYRNIYTRFCSFLSRCKAAFKLIFLGDLELQADFIIEDPEVMANIINTFREGKKYLLSCKNEDRVCCCDRDNN